MRLDDAQDLKLSLLDHVKAAADIAHLADALAVGFTRQLGLQLDEGAA